uniref:Uncharacterized protein n=1 Tax=viral metagenome TaxID=1070528 RepID=A0A6C0DBV1_9ZZZZ
MSIISKEIKIYFYSNFNNEKIDFDLNKLYSETKEDGKTVYLNKTGLNTLPYFSLNVKYPKDKLLFNLKTYQERVNFFFDEKKFEYILKSYTVKSDFDIDEDITKIAEYNIMTMLELLFPTKFTAINNFHTSYDHIYGNNSDNPLWFDLVTQKNYSYLKLLDGEIYTFIRLVWLNDLLNNPEYRKIIDNFIIFWNWYKREINKVTKKESDLKIETKKIIDIILNDIEKNVKLPENTELTKKINQQIASLETLKDNIEKGKELSIIIEEIKEFYKGDKGSINTNLKTKVNANINKINKNIESINKEIKKNEDFKNLIKQTGENYSSSKYPEYRNFLSLKSKYTDDKYSYPKLISNNDKLKEFLSNSDADGMTQFFNIFEKIYNLYIAGIPEKLDENDSKTLKEIINTSIIINYPDSNSSISNKFFYEIHIMADFIKGKVDDEISNKIFCPYVGDYLGNMFEFLFRAKLYGKTDKQDVYRWDITRNRVSFSIKDNELKNGEISEQPNREKNKNAVQNKNNLYKNAPQNNNKSGNNINVAKFKDEVYSTEEIIKKDGIIEQLAKYQISIDQTNILEYLKNNNDLYNIIIESYKDEINQNKKLLETMVKLQYNYEGENQINNNKIANIKKDTGYNEIEIFKLEKNILLNKLYIEIVKKLYEIEDKKNRIISRGGTKKRHIFKKKYHTYKKYRL